MFDGRPRASLVKYDPPLELGTGTRGKEDKKLSLPPVEFKPQIEDVLHALLPPREWVGGNDRHMIQYASSTTATRVDVIQLQEALDHKLLERQARETGICPVREELYAQGFDELIRQITINCPERGLLLLRVRDEIRLTIAAYQTLYASSVTFGTRKQLQSEQGKSEMEESINNLERKKKSLEANVTELKNQAEAIERRESEKRAIEERKRKEEIDFLKHQGAHLESFLASLEKN